MPGDATGTIPGRCSAVGDMRALQRFLKACTPAFVTRVPEELKQIEAAWISCPPKNRDQAAGLARALTNSIVSLLFSFRNRSIVFSVTPGTLT
jgi:hypothetical protein